MTDDRARPVVSDDLEADLHRLSVVLGGRRIDGPYHRLRLACGLEASAGAPPPMWSRDVDAPVATDNDRIHPADVGAVAALDSISPTEVAAVVDSESLGRWLAGAPLDQRLAEADAATIDHVARLATLDVPVSLAVLTELLHRKRPLLVPVTNHQMVDGYRRYTGAGDLRATWPALVKGIAFDLRQPSNALALAMIGVRLANELSHAPDTLRRVDLLLRATSMKST